MAKLNRSEEWREIKFPKDSLRNKYAISNKGRIISYDENIEQGVVLKGSITGGYPTLNIKPGGKDKTLYIHRLVAENFLEKSAKTKSFVIHIDYDKLNNDYKNLKWVTRSELIAHQASNPNVIEHRAKLNSVPRDRGHKLTIGKVKEIKRMLSNPNRRLKMKQIAEKFGISEMQLYRIKSGENWSHVEL